MRKETVYEYTPNCPRCGTMMHRRGSTFSGSKKIVLWGCGRCGKTTTKDKRGQMNEYPLKD